MADFRMGASRDLPVVDGAWDGPAAAGRMMDACGIGGDNPNTTRARRGFLIYDASAPELRGSYHLPFADIRDGTLTAIGGGLRAAASRLPQMNGVGQDLQDRARAVLDAYFAKLNSDSGSSSARDVIHKTTIERAPGSDPYTYVMSDETVDRYGDVISASGWKLHNFKRNPIALFNHDTSFPIGTWSNVRVEGKALVGRLNLMSPVSERLAELRAAVDAGVLRAVSVGFRSNAAEPMSTGKGMRFTDTELVECSLVATPANPNALQIVKSLVQTGKISAQTAQLICGREFSARRTKTGGSAEIPPSGQTSMELSKKIERSEDRVNALRARLDEITADFDDDDEDSREAYARNSAEINRRLETEIQLLEGLKRSERMLGEQSEPVQEEPRERVTGTALVRGAPYIANPQRFARTAKKEINGFDAIVRSIVVRGVAACGPGDKSLERVLDERYPGDGMTSAMVLTRASSPLGMVASTTTGFAMNLARTTWADFMQALMGVSFYPVLRSRGIAVAFDGNGTVTFPGRTAGGAGGGFFAEGGLIPAGRVTITATSMTAFQMGVIVPFSRKLAQQSTPSIEAVVRQAILEDWAATLDPLVVDATAASTSRPAGLLNGVSAAASGYGGGDYRAVQEDFKALLAPFITANASDGITVIMNPSQGLSVSLMDSPVGNPNWFAAIRDRVTIVESTNATANRLIALRNSDFVTALGDTPQFDISEQASLIFDTAPTTSMSYSSLWQRASIGVRMICDISWAMRRSGMVQWINTTTW